MRSEMVHYRTTTDKTSQKAGRPQIVFGPEDESFHLFSRLVERVTARPLVGGNDIVPLTNGIEAYPAMLQGIEGAKRSAFPTFSMAPVAGSTSWMLLDKRIIAASRFGFCSMQLLRTIRGLRLLDGSANKE